MEQTCPLQPSTSQEHRLAAMGIEDDTEMTPRGSPSGNRSGAGSRGRHIEASIEGLRQDLTRAAEDIKKTNFIALMQVKGTVGGAPNGDNHEPHFCAPASAQA